MRDKPYPPPPPPPPPERIIREGSPMLAAIFMLSIVVAGLFLGLLVNAQ